MFDGGNGDFGGSGCDSGRVIVVVVVVIIVGVVGGVEVMGGVELRVWG